ncbi:MAG: hypothetical protein ACE149_17770 [Armatimonadota bacterium]
MSDTPDAPNGEPATQPAGEQETTTEASAEERTPQRSVGRPSAEASGEGGAPPSHQPPQRAGQEQVARGDQGSPAQQFYWRRQAEKLEKELAALRAEREAELSRTTRDRDEAAARATEAEWRAERLDLFHRSGLPTELLELVPEGDPRMVAAYIERLKPIAEKLSRPHPRGLTNTNPPNRAGRDEARLERLAAEAARGDRRALREYAHLRQRVK